MTQNPSTTGSRNQLEFKIERILVPLDFSSASKEALDYAVSLAKQFRAAIHLVHVYPPDEASSVPGAGHLLLQSAEAIQRLNEELAGIHRKQRFRVDFHHWQPRHAEILVFSFTPIRARG